MSTTATQCLANRETNLAAQRSDEASQQGTEAQCYVGNDASEHSRNWILSGTFSQCSSRRSGVVCSDLLTEKTSRAAAFNTDWRCCRSAPDAPVNTEQQ